MYSINAYKSFLESYFICSYLSLSHTPKSFTWACGDGVGVGVGRVWSGGGGGLYIINLRPPKILILCYREFYHFKLSIIVSHTYTFQLVPRPCPVLPHLPHLLHLNVLAHNNSTLIIITKWCMVSSRPI